MPPPLLEPVEKDKVAHAVAGFGLLAAALFLTEVSPLAWILVIVGLSWPPLWELVMRHQVDREGFQDISASYAGGLIAALVWGAYLLT